jgi:ureidoglycolate lyase
MTFHAGGYLALEFLTEAAFAPFGEVIGAMPRPGGRRYLDAYAVAAPGLPTRCWVSTFAPEASGRLAIAQLEAHPHSAQVFVALQPGRFIVVVASAGADGQPDPASCRAFLADGPSGIIYRRGVWHAGMMVLDAVSSFFVVQGLVAEGNDLFVPLPAPLTIEGADRLSRPAANLHRTPTGGA